MQSFHHISVPSLSSLYTLDGRLPTLGSQDYSRIPRLRRHNWTAAEKQVLYLLNATYSNNNPPGELWTVFNAFFKEGRPRRGWVGPRRTAWETMRVFIMNPVRYCPWWTGAEARRVRGELERVARGVGVRLLGKGWGGGSLTPVRGRRSRRPGSVSSVGDGLHSVRSMSPEQGTVRRKLFDADSAKRAAVTNGLLTPPPTVKKKNGKWKSESETDIAVPSIAFRGKQYYIRKHRDLKLTFLRKPSTTKAKASTAPTASSPEPSSTPPPSPTNPPPKHNTSRNCGGIWRNSIAELHLSSA